MVEITDGNSAQAWLETQPHQVRVWFAARCALRATPGLGFETGKKLDHLALVSFRAMHISGVSGTCPAVEMSRLDSAAFSAASSVANNISG